MKKYNHVVLILILAVVLALSGCGGGNGGGGNPGSGDQGGGTPGGTTDTSVALTMITVPTVSSFPTGLSDLETPCTTVNYPYQIAQTEVTYEQWYAVYTWAVANGYTFIKQGREGAKGSSGAAPTAAKLQPVTTITWYDAIIWCNALTEYYAAKNGTSYECVYYTDSDFTTPTKNISVQTLYINAAATGFRLPTSMEWELAARYIGDKNGDGDILDSGEYYPGVYASGADADYNNADATKVVAWYYDNSNITQVVAQLSSNTLGLYDMSGNVWEWCFDENKDDNSKRVLRGGCCFNYSNILQLAFLNSAIPSASGTSIGIRPVRTE